VSLNLAVHIVGYTALANAPPEVVQPVITGDGNPSAPLTTTHKTKRPLEEPEPTGGSEEAKRVRLAPEIPTPTTQVQPSI